MTRCETGRCLRLRPLATSTRVLGVSRFQPIETDRRSPLCHARLYATAFASATAAAAAAVIQLSVAALDVLGISDQLGCSQTVSQPVCLYTCSTSIVNPVQCIVALALAYSAEKFEILI